MSGGNRHVGRRRVEPLHAAGGRHAHQTVAWLYPLDSPPSRRLLPSRRPSFGPPRRTLNPEWAQSSPTSA